jgi:hypothetical protein
MRSTAVSKSEILCKNTKNYAHTHSRMHARMHTHTHIHTHTHTHLIPIPTRQVTEQSIPDIWISCLKGPMNHVRL